MVVTSWVTCAVLRKYAFITVVVFSNEMSLLNYLQLIVFMTPLLALCLVVRDPLDVAFPLVYIYGACVSKEFHLYMWDQSLWCHGSLTRGPWVKAEGCHDDKLATSSCIRCYMTTLSAQVVVNMTTSVQPVMTICHHISFNIISCLCTPWAYGIIYISAQVLHKDHVYDPCLAAM